VLHRKTNSNSKYYKYFAALPLFFDKELQINKIKKGSAQRNICNSEIQILKSIGAGTEIFVAANKQAKTKGAAHRNIRWAIIH